jgi:hypothetical protein
LKKIVLFCLCVFVSFVCSSQTEISDSENIKTVILTSNAVNFYAPIVRLNEPLNLSFDDLNADEHDYTYKIEHCNIDWSPSDLRDSEFVDGYVEDRIRNYENSFNTLQPFTHYAVTIPNENTKLKISGNYKIYVYNEDEEIVFQRKFVVYEEKTTIGVSIHRSRDISNIETSQSVEFIVNNPNFRINNPKQELYPVILQNNNWDTAISGLKPQFFRGNQLIYKYNKETSFLAGNEFLYFDSKSIRNSTLNIARAELEGDLYHSYLYTNEERIDAPYTLFPDINGNFIIRNLDSDESDLDADYSWVHFSLKSREDLDGKDVYISGNYNNWQLNELNKLKFNENLGLYEKAILLKQGFYNFQYVTKNEDGIINNSDIDGSFYQTENDYTVILYYTKFGSRYTRVIGVGFGNSKKITN